MKKNRLHLGDCETSMSFFCITFLHIYLHLVLELSCCVCAQMNISYLLGFAYLFTDFVLYYICVFLLLQHSSRYNSIPKPCKNILCDRLNTFLDLFYSLFYSTYLYRKTVPFLIVVSFFNSYYSLFNFFFTLLK